MDTSLAKTIRDAKSQGVFLVVVTIVIVKPDLFLGWPEIAGPYKFESLFDTLMTMLHSLYGIGTKRYAGSDFSKVRCLFIDRHRNATVMESDAKSEARDTCLAVSTLFLLIY